MFESGMTLSSICTFPVLLHFNRSSFRQWRKGDCPFRLWLCGIDSKISDQVHTLISISHFFVISFNWIANNTLLKVEHFYKNNKHKQLHHLMSKISLDVTHVWNWYNRQTPPTSYRAGHMRAHIFYRYLWLYPFARSLFSLNSLEVSIDKNIFFCDLSSFSGLYLNFSTSKMHCLSSLLPLILPAIWNIHQPCQHMGINSSNDVNFKKQTIYREGSTHAQ